MLNLHEISDLVRGRLVGAGASTVDDVSTDSRRLPARSLFVALTGDRFDGHDYLADVASRGAVAALVSREPEGTTIPRIVVADTRRALADLAAGWRSRFALPLIVVSGSNGKTTTKEMLAAILAAAHGESDRLATAGNLNNDIGVPLTLLRLRTHHRAAVVELGMNHPGETGELARIAAPTVALVVNAQREHQEFMRSVEAVAHEHALAIAAVPETGAVAFPADDDHAQVWRHAAGARRIVDFACVTDADAVVPEVAVLGRAHFDASFTVLHLDTPLGATTARLAAAGLHNVRNATAAAAAAIAARIPLAAIRQGLEAFRPVAGRSQVASHDGVTVIDDSYNANPDSMRAAIDLLARYAEPRLLVVGDMGEVGEDGPRFHREIGAHAKAQGIATLQAMGDASRDVVDAFGTGAAHFDAVEPLIAAARGWVADARRDGTPTVLVKGSRFMKMERVVAALRGTTVEGGH